MDTFGVNVPALIAQILSFTVVAWVLWRFAFKPVLATINPGNDLIELIEDRGVGRVSIENDGGDLAELAIQLVDCELTPSIQARCRAVAAHHFSAENAAAQIVRALT